MAAIHRELVYYLCEALENKKFEKPNVLIIGIDSELMASLLPENYSTQVVADYSKIDQELITGKSYDAAVLNDVFRNSSLVQIEQLLNIVLRAVRVDGVVEVRQHLHDSKWNLAQYANLFYSYQLSDVDAGKSFGFKIIWEQSLRDTIFSRHDWHDHCWLLEKSEAQRVASSENEISVGHCLNPDHSDLNRRIIKFQWLCGQGFFSPGGETQSEKFLSQLHLKPGHMVLDIGCGVGGCAFQIAKNYGAHVIGVDVLPNFVSVACDSASLKKDGRVRFITADISTIEFPANTFDVVYSRDCSCYIVDKNGLFEKIYKWLKPGGRILVTDGMRSSDNQPSTKLQSYISKYRMTLWSIDQYVDAVARAGFVAVQSRDTTDQFQRLLEIETSKAQAKKQEFIELFSEKEFDPVIEEFRGNLEYILDGEWKWGMIIAEKSQAQ